MLKLKAKKSGLTVSEFCRKSALDKKIVERLTDEQINIFKMLIKYHNNFKSIANLYKRKDPYLSVEVLKVAEEITKILNLLKK